MRDTCRWWSTSVFQGLCNLFEGLERLARAYCSSGYGVGHFEDIVSEPSVCVQLNLTCLSIQTAGVLEAPITGGVGGD